jgi:hypothetical protein
MVYYDGYGYNFYYATYAYYENSKNEIYVNTDLIIGIIVASFIGLAIFFVLVGFLCKIESKKYGTVFKLIKKDEDHIVQ